MNRLKMIRLTVPALLALASSAAVNGAGADGYRSAQPHAVDVEVREWSTPYTLDIPAELGNGRQGGHVLTYAPGHGLGPGVTPPRADGPPLAQAPLCASGHVFATGIGCVHAYRPSPGTLRGALPFNDGQLALPDQRRYRQR